MSDTRRSRTRGRTELPKAATGIAGLDELTAGGLPRGRPTLVCGDAGSGKTLLGMEFLVRGARQFKEPGVFVAFEETARDITQNVASLGFAPEQLIRKGLLHIEQVSLDRGSFVELGDYDLEGLFVRLDDALRRVKARRIVLDSLETLFGALSNTGILRAELVRLFRWLKDRGVTTLITAERGGGQLTRHGLEEYVSDCVILLDHRVVNGVATRRVRVVKYRGSRHGTDEHPFMIGDSGFSVLPVTSLGLQHQAPTQRMPTGIQRLDAMLGGKGYYRGSCILVSGTAGTGKTSIAAHLLASACARGERCLAFLFEESTEQLIRNMRSIGVDLAPHIASGKLHVHAARPWLLGLEQHLVTMQTLVREINPRVVTIDPVTNLDVVGTGPETRSMLTRLVDDLKCRNVTTLFTSLTTGDAADGDPGLGISSLMDTWLMVRDVEANGEHSRVLHVRKSRGMAHSNQLREFRLTGHGIDLLDVYVGSGTVLTGTARLVQETREAEQLAATRQQALQRKDELEMRQRQLEMQLDMLRHRIESVSSERALLESSGVSERRAQVRERNAMATARQADRARRPEGRA